MSYKIIKKYGLLPLLCFLPFLSFSQNEDFLSGTWQGSLETPAGELRLILHLDIKNEKKWEASLDSPDQGVKGIEVSDLRYTGDSLIVKSGQIMAIYRAAYSKKDSTMKGKWQQGLSSMNLRLKKTEHPDLMKRPQEPKAPFPYKTKEVTFTNAEDSIELAGTLSLPKGKGPFPAAVLITGSGPQDRNEELMGHKPFLVLSDFLTRHGIAVLRYDDRGVAKSEGNFAESNTMDFSRDAEAAFAFLEKQKKIDSQRTGLIGHSEGGMIAPIVAARNQEVDFIVLMAGVGIPGDSLLLLQQRAILKANGISDSTIQANEKASLKIFASMKTDIEKDSLKKRLSLILKGMPDYAKEELGINSVTISPRVNQMTSSWYRSFILFHPANYLVKVTCPVLAVNGSKDLQVPSEINLKSIKKHVKKGGNEKVTIKEFKSLNHLFQEAETGSPSEYGKIEQTMSPELMEYLASWILKI